MSFGAAFGAGATQVQTGPELEEISTETLGFLSFKGDSKIKLLSTPWPSDNLPPSTSSLLAIAPHNGLLAAAGPDGLVIAKTDAVRKAFLAETEGDDHVKSFTPHLHIPSNMRLSQLAFTSDEVYLIVSAENGGGMAVYEVQSLLRGDSNTSFEMSTNGMALRSMADNPAPQTAALVAVVTDTGRLFIANLQTKELSGGPNGEGIKDGVSCVSWSNKGKQLVAGLANGALVQLGIDGSVKAEIPRPPDLQDNFHVSSIIWLENDMFLTVHTPNTPSDAIVPSEFHIISRQKGTSNYTFSKMADPATPFGLNRQPNHHFMPRLRHFPPDLTDLIIVASTCSTDIGMLSRSSKPLADEIAADKITNTFTTTMPGNDSRRAILPTTEDMSDTTPIGASLDLSATEKVETPIPGDAIDRSSTALPAFMVLNNEGVLSAWWIIYSDSIKQGTIFPELAVATDESSNSFASNTQAQPSSFATSTFGSPGPAAGSFGRPTPSAFGAPGVIGASPSGKPQSPWGSSSTLQAPGSAFGQHSFGKPSFGTPSALGGPAGPNFASHELGQQKSVWGTSTFGKSSFGTNSGEAAFGSTEPTPMTPTSGGFSSFAKVNPFASASPANQSPFSATKPMQGGFGSGSTFHTETLFNDSSMQAESAFGSNNSAIQPTSPFNTGSSFKPDSNVTGDKQDSKNAGGSFFGPGFANVLYDIQEPAAQPESKEADMEDSADMAEERKSVGPLSTSPTNEPPPAASLFGNTPKPPETQMTVQPSRPIGVYTSTTPSETPMTSKIRSILNESPEPPSTVIKKEHEEFIGVDQSIPEAPLPPDPTSLRTPEASPRNVHATSDGQVSPDYQHVEKSSLEAPLPPDFLTMKKSPVAKPFPSDEQDRTPKAKSPQTESFEEAALPDDSIESGESAESEGTGEDSEFDDEGSGEDITKDIVYDEPEDTTRVTQVTLESPGGPKAAEYLTGLRQHQRNDSRPLFGELHSTTPLFPPPMGSKINYSPRSPSPVRPVLRDTIRSASPRSIEASNFSRSAIANRKSMYGKTPAMLAQSQVGRGVSPAEAARLERAKMALLIERRRAEEEQQLSDHEDELVREELQAPIEPTKTLDPFVAHQDYVGSTNKSGVTGQIERLYRDINSMIDTLGINAHSMQAFVAGHKSLYKDGGRTRKDLEVEDDWVLDEILDLISIEESLQDQLLNRSLHDIPEILQKCKEAQLELAKLRTRRQDVRKMCEALTDPAQIENQKFAPLTAEQASVQNDLRRSYTGVQKQLAEAETAVTMLRAKLVSLTQTSDDAAAPLASPMRKAPTMEAITNTIKKMTSMISNKRDDIDVLEQKMQKLRMSSVELVMSPTPSRLRSSPSPSPSRELTPYRASSVTTTPLPSSARSVRFRTSRDTTPFFTPDANRNSRFGGSVGSTTGEICRRRGGIQALDEEMLAAVRKRMEVRKKKLDMLGKAIEQGGRKWVNIE